MIIKLGQIYGAYPPFLLLANASPMEMHLAYRVHEVLEFLHKHYQKLTFFINKSLVAVKENQQDPRTHEIHIRRLLSTEVQFDCIHIPFNWKEIPKNNISVLTQHQARHLDWLIPELHLSFSNFEDLISEHERNFEVAVAKSNGQGVTPGVRDEHGMATGLDGSTNGSGESTREQADQNIGVETDEKRGQRNNGESRGSETQKPISGDDYQLQHNLV